MSLDKVLQFAAGPARPVDSAELVRAASEDLEHLALLLAQPDDDGEGDEDEPDDDESSGDDEEDEDTPPKGKKKGKGKIPPAFMKKKGADDKVKACQALVADAMTALAQLQGGEILLTGTPGQPMTSQERVSLVLSLAKGGGGDMGVAMDHGPFEGTHEHAHRVVQVHSHAHTHNKDSRHACGERAYGDY